MLSRLYWHGLPVAGKEQAVVGGFWVSLSFLFLFFDHCVDWSLHA